MSDRWLPVTKPGAELTALDPQPVPRGDGATWQRFRTARGKVFAQVVERSGLVLWYQQVGG